LAFAKSAALPLFDAMDFIMGDESSVWTGLSSFGAEIAALNGILERASGFSLIILDEPAKGTNPEEGRAVAAALAKRLNGQMSISVIATHYDNVAAADYRRYTTAGLKKGKVAAAEKLTPELIPELMDYRLVEVTQSQASAQAAPRDALTICKLLGLDAGVIELIEGELGF
jgi:dsDNA-specific endonuclease/ATPase MutS2